MKKLLFASLLTSAIVLAQTGGGTTRVAEKTGTKSTTSGKKTKTNTKVRKGPKKMSNYNEASHSPEVTDKGGNAAPKTAGGCHGKDTPTGGTKGTKQPGKKGSTSKAATGQSPTKTAQ